MTGNKGYSQLGLIGLFYLSSDELSRGNGDWSRNYSPLLPASLALEDREVSVAVVASPITSGIQCYHSDTTLGGHLVLTGYPHEALNVPR